MFEMRKDMQVILKNGKKKKRTGMGYDIEPILVSSNKLQASSLARGSSIDL